MVRSLVLLGVAGLMAGIAGAYGAVKLADRGASYAPAPASIQTRLLFEKAYRDVLGPDPRWSMRSR